MAETKLTAADIVAALLQGDYSIAERVTILRAFRDSIPGLVAFDPRLRGPVRAARAMSKDRFDTTINALENSEVWQKTAATTPAAIRLHHDFVEEARHLAEETKTMLLLLIDNIDYQRYLGAEKVRMVIKAGRGISGEAAPTIKQHLELIDATGPARRKSTPAEAAKKQ